MTREEMIRQSAIRHIGCDYDTAILKKLLNGTEQPHPEHEEPLIKAFIAGAKWADNNPKTSTLAEACRKKQGDLKTQMEYEDHHCDKTLYGQFQVLLYSLGAMSGCSDHIHWSQHFKEEKSSFIVHLSINDKGTIRLNFELIKD